MRGPTSAEGEATIPRDGLASISYVSGPDRHRQSEILCRTFDVVQSKIA